MAEKNNDIAEIPVTTENPKSSECEDVFGGPVFEPRLYIQRYFYVKQQLSRFQVKHVVDFGSAECKISRFLVRTPTLHRLTLVDLDEALLEWNKHAIRPWTCDYLEKRDLPLHVQMYCGSVTELDTCIIGCDAVSMVEIIEHLQPDVLRAAVDMVFGRLQPHVIVITTPNADFNQLFPNFSGMRHWDHKFEWSRQEFQDWCENICRNYPYNVEFGGIGEPPPGSLHLGHCSQSAVFVREPDKPKEDYSKSITNSYKLIAESFYPFKETRMSEEETILNEIKYLMRQYTSYMETVTGSCEMCAFNRSLYEHEAFARNQEEFGSSVCHAKSKDDSESGGNQALLPKQDLLSEGKTYADFSRKQSEVTDNQGLLQTTDWFCDRKLNIDSDNSEDQSTNVARNLRCPNCMNCDQQWNECYIPVSFLMSRKMKTILQTDQLRKFLQDHGYRLSEDSKHVVITLEDSHDDRFDDYNYDYEDIETYQSDKLDNTGISNTDLPGNAQFNFKDALDSESWD